MIRNSLRSRDESSSSKSDQSERQREAFYFQKASIAQKEEMGLFPRAFNRVFDRFVQQLSYDVSSLVVEEYRFYRYLFFTSIKCLFLLLFVPLFVNILAKNYVVRPLTEYYWNTKQSDIFFNEDQKKHAFAEFQDYESKLYFESFCPETEVAPPLKGSLEERSEDKIRNEREVEKSRILELAISYNNQSIELITNILSDFISFSTLCFLVLTMKIQIIITKNFIFEVFFGLTDSRKSLIIFLITDLLVGYHSGGTWVLFFQCLFEHYGIPENHTVICLLVGTLPVILDVLFKYLIFRHLNRISPTTVATYYAMIE